MRDRLNDMQLYLIDEYVEDYQEGLLTRREALRRITAITGSVVFATSLLAACGPTENATTGSPAAGAGATATTGTSPTAAGSPTAAAANTPGTTAGAAQPTPGGPDPEVHVAEDDPALSASLVEFPGENATLQAYLAQPTGDGPFPIILVCHENRGLTSYIQDVTRRLAKAGYLAMAVDLLSRQGGTASLTADEIPGALGNLPEGQPVQDFQSGLRHAQGLPSVDKTKVGMVGFCYGGGVTWRVATRTPELRAAVPFYGPPPRAEDVPGIQAAVLAIYAEMDQRINASIPEIEAAMQQHNKIFEKQIYPGVNHAFHNDTGPRYNREAARDAWEQALAWFERYVKA